MQADSASRGMLRDIGLTVAFLSRVPLPSMVFGGSPAAVPALYFAPVVGVLVAGLQTVVLALAWAVGLPNLGTAVLLLVVSIVATGALHEDGLADVADAFGGMDRDRRLAIMRDSRIGTFGALAVGCSLLLRAAALGGLLDRLGFLGTAAALFIAAPTSRALMLLPLTVLPPARPDGLARAAGKFPIGKLLIALASAGAVGLGAVSATHALAEPALAAAALATVASWLVTRWAARAIGGVTGDVIGACQQLAEMSMLLALSTA